MSVHEAAMSAGLQVSGGVMLAGGVMAQQSHDTNVGTAGIMFGITGLLTALYPWFTKLLDTIQAGRRIKELEDNIASSKAEAVRQIADAKVEAKREVDMARAEDKIDADRKMLDLRIESEKRVAMLEEKLARYEDENRAAAVRRHDKMDDVSADIVSLKVASKEVADTVNTLIPAVRANAEAAGVEAPKVHPVSPPVS